jgi:DNA-binding transcriptional ArsR family regulator
MPPVPEHPPARRARVRDPQVLRALAHPLRSRLLGLLRTDGPSTASRLGERVGESSGVTSYHLRQLEQYGFVTEVAGRGSKRERWWQAEHRRTSWEPDELIDQPGGLDANAQMQRLQVEVMGRELRAWLAAEQPRAWAAVAGMSDYLVHLTPEQTRELLDELYAVLDRWSETHREPGEGTAPVNVFTVAVPRVQP